VTSSTELMDIDTARPERKILLDLDNLPNLRQPATF
jgi:hypothetical protein